MQLKNSFDKHLKIRKSIEDSIKLKSAILNDNIIQDAISEIIEKIVHCFQNKRKVFFCGNGGSAADSQHLASEFSGKFYLDRKPLNAEALHVNSSYLTAIANDYSFTEVFARALEAKGSKADILVCLTTSGKSENILSVLKKAKEMEIITVCFLGNETKYTQQLTDIQISVPSIETPRIQEAHMLIGHIICEQVENQLFG